MPGGSPIDVPLWIDRQKVSPLQIAITLVCGAAVMLDGFDAQIIGLLHRHLFKSSRSRRPRLPQHFPRDCLVFSQAA